MSLSSPQATLPRLPNPKLQAGTPSLLLAPMDGLTDGPMRALQGEFGAFSFSVSEFVRVSTQPVPVKVFHRDVPELLEDSRTVTGLPVQVQLLGGDPELMALSAQQALVAGATALDINFGCPAPTVNRHDGGATILQYPHRVRDLVKAVREAVPPEVPVSAKIRLGWSDIGEFESIAEKVVEGGADWLVVHCRTKQQGYQPPVYWEPLGRIRENLGIPLVPNGDIWTLDDFRRCREQTGCEHFMLGRGAIANPSLAREVACELGIERPCQVSSLDWIPLLDRLHHYCMQQEARLRRNTFHRLKQWLRFASKFGDFPHFQAIKRTESKPELFEILQTLQQAEA